MEFLIKWHSRSCRNANVKYDRLAESCNAFDEQ